MAQSTEDTTIAAWVDMSQFNLAFERSVVSASGGKAPAPADAKLANLSAMRHLLSEKGYSDCQISFNSYASKHPSKKKVPYDVIITQEFFKKMAGGNLEKAKKMVTDVIAKQEKLEKTTTKTGTSSKAADATKRLTDTSKYTGSHKERFDESGKGKGSDGRVDRVENKGYVGAYKGEGTFKGDKK